MGHRPAGGLRAPRARGAAAGHRGLSALGLAAALAAGLTHADEGAAIAGFARAPPGAELPAPRRARILPGIKPAEVDLVADGGPTVLRIRASAAAGSASHPLSVSLAAWFGDFRLEAAEASDLSGRPG